MGIANQAQRADGVELGPTCFRRSNNKTLEYVLIRLFSIIEGKDRAKREFKGMLPVLDKVQQAPFYQKIGEWLNELKKVGRLEASVILPVSALKTNTSSRLVLLLLALSNLALQRDLEATCPGASRLAHLPDPGPSASAPVGLAGFNGLLDDSSLLPPELRLGIAVTRAKEAAAEFVEHAAAAAHACGAIGRTCQDFTRKYYELQTELARHHPAQVEAIADVGSGEPGAKTPRAGSPGAASTAPGGSSILFGPAAGALAASLSGFGAGDTSDQQLLQGAAKGRKDPSAEQVARLSALVASLNEHLHVHEDLAKVLMTEDIVAKGGIATNGSGSGGAAVTSAEAPGILRQAPQPLQRLHPYQIDGAVLTVDAAAAATKASEPLERNATPEAMQRRQQRPNLMPFKADNIVGAVQSFSSVLCSVSPHILQLAKSRDNAGPPPLLQPPSQPSSHAAHAAHQLQVHRHASKQVLQLRRQAQEEVVACEAVLQGLREIHSRVDTSRLAGYDFFDEEPQQRSWQQPQLAPDFGDFPTSSGAHGGGASAAHEFAGWRPPAAAGAPPGHVASARASAAAPSSPAPTSTVTSPTTTAPPYGGGGPMDGLAWLQTRMRNLQTGSAAPSTSGAGPQAPAAANVSVAASSVSHAAHTGSTATSGGAWDVSPRGPAGVRIGSAPGGLHHGVVSSPVPGSPTNSGYAMPAWLQSANFPSGAGESGGVAGTAPTLHSPSAFHTQRGATAVPASPDWQAKSSSAASLFPDGQPRSPIHAAAPTVPPTSAGAAQPPALAMPAPAGCSRSQDLSYLPYDDELNGRAPLSNSSNGCHSGGFGMRRAGSLPGGVAAATAGGAAPSFGALGTGVAADGNADDDFGLLAAESEGLSLALGGGIAASPAARAPAGGFPTVATPGRACRGSAWSSPCGGGADAAASELGHGEGNAGSGGNAAGALTALFDLDGMDDVQVAAMDVDSPKVSRMTMSPVPAVASPMAPSALAQAMDPKLLALKARMQAVTSRP